MMKKIKRMLYKLGILKYPITQYSKALAIGKFHSNQVFIWYDTSAKCLCQSYVSGNEVNFVGYSIPAKGNIDTVYDYYSSRFDNFNDLILLGSCKRVITFDNMCWFIRNFRGDLLDLQSSLNTFNNPILHKVPITTDPRFKRHKDNYYISSKGLSVVFLTGAIANMDLL